MDFDERFWKFLWEECGERYEKYNFYNDFLFQVIIDIYLYFNFLQELELEEQGDGDVVVFLVIIVFFILLIVWVNYINLFMVRLIERVWEVGVWKILGVIWSQLVN